MSAQYCEKCNGPNDGSISDPWCMKCCREAWQSKDSPNEPEPEKKTRSDLERIKGLIETFEEMWGVLNVEARLSEENSILRELLTSWQGITAADYQTDNRLHLNMLTKRMLEGGV